MVSEKKIPTLTKLLRSIVPKSQIDMLCSIAITEIQTSENVFGAESNFCHAVGKWLNMHN